MHRWTKLNDQQQSLLTDIINGADISTKTGSKLSLYALRDRGLVTLHRDSGIWTADITHAGDYYLNHGIHPDHPSLQPKQDKKGTDGSPRSNGPVDGDANSPDPAITTDDVLSLLADESRPYGRIFPKSAVEQAGWLRSVREFRQKKLSPSGKHIRYANDHVGIRIWLEGGEDPHQLRRQQDHSPISVPERVSRLHDAVAAFKGNNQLEVSKRCQARALRILHALALEAERRGHMVTRSSNDGNTARLRISVDGHSYPIGICEENDRVPHEPRAYELRQKERNTYFRIPEWDAVPSGRLILELPSTRKTNRYRWADRKRGDLERKLPDVLAEIEARAIVDERRRLEAERQAEVRRREWEAAMADARVAYVEYHRGEILNEQLLTLERVDRLRGFCSRVEEKINVERGRADAEAVNAAESWLVWAKLRIEQIDPLRTLPSLPVEPDIEPADLKPFIKGWSVHEPHMYGQWSRLLDS